jgi:hypothetical protein
MFLPLPAIADFSTTATGGERVGVRGSNKFDRAGWLLVAHSRLNIGTLNV